MNRRSRHATIASLLLNGVLLCAQDPATNPSSGQLRARPLDSMQSGTIFLDVVATAHRSATVEAISSMDFALFDNRKKVPPASLQLLPGSASATQTRQLLFVIDAINSSLAEVSRSEDALETFLAASATLTQPTTILVVSDTEPHDKGSATDGDTTALHHRQLFVHRIPQSTDPGVLLRALRDYKPGLRRILEAQAGPGQAERVRLSLEAVSFLANAQTPIPGAKIVVWISPGWPFLQTSAAKSNAQLFDSIVFLSNLLRSARIMLDSVSPEGLTAGQFPQSSFAGPRDRANPANISSPGINSEPGDTFYKTFLKGAQNAKDSNPNDLALQVLAIQSGGLVLQHGNDLAAYLAQCATEIQSLVTLAYTPLPGDGTDRYHDLTLKSTTTNQALRTRTGFYLH